MKLDRNGPCPCGSGLKYKKCHGAAGAAPLAPAAPSARARLQPQQLFAMALDHHRAGEFAAAAALYEELRQAHPANPDVLHNLGLVEGQLGRAEQALAWVEAAVQAAPQRADLRASLGAMLVMAQRFADAVRCLEPLAQAGLLEAQGRHNFAAALARAGQGSRARAQLEAHLAQAPRDSEAWGLLGNTCTDLRDWAGAETAYARVLALQPDSAAVQSNRLLMAQYDERLTPQQLLDLHAEFGAVQQGLWPHLPLGFANRPEPQRRLRVGLLSPDFGEHPVGYLLLPLLEHLDPARFEIRLYACRARKDRMSERLRARAADWIEVHALSDAALLARLRADRVDVLVDLAGHTSGNRLAVLARRAAPVQLSLLGYPSTTGLDAVDLRVSDAWIDPEGIECGPETVARLPGGLFRYAPPADAPEPASPPLLARGAPSLGVFGNLAKFSRRAVAVWAAVFKACEGARLVLKAGGLADAEHQERLLQEFEAAGVPRSQIVCLPWTDHVEHLRAYAEIDLMLDALPFNFAGNSCEALWMGVPVLSLRGDRPAGRMGESLLRTADRAEWVFNDADALCRAAQSLLADPDGLASLRAGQREHLRRSRLLDGASLAREFDAALRQAWQQWCVGAPTYSGPRKVLHVGCGNPESGLLPAAFEADLWRELRVDLDPAVKPDVIASITDLSPVPQGTVDAVYSSHNLEHVFPREVPKALGEFLRVLRPGGFALITLPDLKSAARALLEDAQDEALYQSPAGPVSAMHLIYSYAPFVEDGNSFMLHKTGFTARSLAQALERAGFERVRVSSHRHCLWAVGFKAGS